MLISNVILKCPAAIFLYAWQYSKCKSKNQIYKKTCNHYFYFIIKLLNFTEGFLLELKFILQMPLSLGTSQLKSKNLKALGFQW